MADYDVIVIGAGNAALAASVSAREAGAKRVVVLEKATRQARGGNTFFSGGLLRFAFSDVEELLEIKQIEPYGIGLGGLDWESLARGFGADGTVVDNEHALGDALNAAQKSGRTTLIAARIDPSGYVDQFNALREL